MVYASYHEKKSKKLEIHLVHGHGICGAHFYPTIYFYLDL